jgi:caffeoyl-CoA O-methyltransferase
LSEGGEALPEPDTLSSRGRRSEGIPGPAEVEAWIRERYAREDPPLVAIRREMEARGFPAIQLPPVAARTVQILLRIAGARRVLEVGTLAGYSALWILRALPPGGHLLTLELDQEHARVARELLERAGEGARVEVRQGDASRILSDLAQDSGERGRWDAVLLDADKEGLPGYVEHAARLLRAGGLLLVDNAFWRGRVMDPGATDDATEALRELHRRLAESPDWDALAIPVGDGILVARWVR